MKIYKSIFFAVCMLMMASIVHAQSLRTERTDVDSSRSSFVTATYLFGIDFYVDGLDSCTAVSFDINYTNSRYISFSEVRNTEFGFHGKEPVIITSKNLSDNTGYVHVGVLSGMEVGERGFDNPCCVHLEFAVAQNAPHGDITVFSFSNVQAVGTGGIIQLTAEDVTYNIHSFIGVWPGDADNDGEVTSKDVTTIGRFLGYGSSSKNSMRSFKRENASTIWASQSVLAWDSIDVSHADCDGNGDVTVTDQLIVALNFGKTHAIGKIANTTQLITEKYLSNEKRMDEFYPPASELEESLSNTWEGARGTLSDKRTKSVLVSSANSFIGVSGTLRWIITDGETKVVGIERGSLFDLAGTGELFSQIYGTSAEISMLNLSAERSEVSSGELCRLIVEGDPDAVQIIEEDFYAASGVFGMFPVNTVCSVEDLTESDLRILTNENSERSLMNLSNETVRYTVYDVSGSEISAGEIPAGASVLPLGLSANHRYFVRYSVGNNFPAMKKM